MVAFFFYFTIAATVLAVIFSIVYWIQEKKKGRR